MPRSMCRALRARRSSIVAATPFLVPLLVPNVAPVFAADMGGLAGLGLSAGPGRVPTTSDAGGRVDLLLDVVVNGQPIGQIGEFQARNGRLFVSRHELRSLGFRVPPPDRQGGSEADMLALDELAGLTCRLDQKTQTLNVTASIEALATTILGGSQENASLLPVESGFGAVIDYDVVGTETRGRGLAEALIDERLFTPWGVVASSFTVTTGPQDGSRNVVRLDSGATVTDPDAIRQYRAGDVIAGGFSWTRPVRLGGIQLSTDFAARPDLVTFPVPAIAGAVAVPSSVDVLVNGVQALSQTVPPGPFAITQLPVVTGVDNVSVVVRNAAGQQTTENLPLYASRSLLAPGLADFSIEAGPVRLNYGLDSNDYRAPAASVSARYGLLQWLTVEGHAEGSAGGEDFGGPLTRAGAKAGGMAGGGAAITVGHLGTLSVDVAESRFGTHGGGLVSAGFERSAPALSFSGSIQMASSGYRDIASVYGDPVPAVEGRASIGLSLPVFGTFGLAYVLVRRPATAAAAALTAQARTPEEAGIVSAQGLDGGGLLALVPASKVSLLSASLSRPVFGGRANVYVTGFHDFASRSSSGFTGGISFTFGPRSAGAISGNAGGGTSAEMLQASQSARTDGDTGYQLIEGLGRPARHLAVGSYRSPWGVLEGGVDVEGHETSLRTDVQGALAFTDGSLFATNTIQDSFAVVDTGAPGIEVLRENRPYGRTDASGKLLVTDLRAYDANRLAIDPMDVPVDSDVGDTMRLVRPQDRSGVIVRFPVRSSRGAVVRLSDMAGVSIAVGSTARLENGPQGADLVVGFDGEVFVTGLEAHNVVAVRPLEAPPCLARFDYKPVAGTLPDIGPIRCVPGPR